MDQSARKLPDDPITFIKGCVRAGQVLWTYHVNLRLQGRFVSREFILDAVDSYELVEAYPDDKYLPSYLVLARRPGEAVHVLFGVDAESRNVRVVTAYRPSPNEWNDDLKQRRTP